jgi:hypothetical protein
MMRLMSPTMGASVPRLSRPVQRALVIGLAVLLLYLLGRTPQGRTFERDLELSAERAERSIEVALANRVSGQYKQVCTPFVHLSCRCVSVSCRCVFICVTPVFIYRRHSCCQRKGLQW